MILSKRLWAEFLGTAGLLIVVVGSGIMAESLSPGNLAMALLANSLATGAGLFALIQTFGPVSGAHFNPVVSCTEWLWKKLSGRDFVFYGFSQLLGAVIGIFLTHAMFGQKIFQLSENNRNEFRFLLSEVIATFGLILVISLSGKRNVATTPLAVALYMTAAYWCTSSTSFANPAITLPRSLTNTFAGIHWTGVLGFIVAQSVGAFAAFWTTSKFEETQSHLNS